MEIVVVHNHYQLPGGEDESYQSEVRLLRDAGHEVIAFTEHNERVNTIGHARTGLRTIWSTESYQQLRGMLRDSNTDILHIQNFFPLISPSVYYAGRAARVPIVQSLRNYRLLCPNAQFFRNGQVCESCMGKTIPWPGVMHSCYRGSRSATAAVMAMIALHRLLGTWIEMVDLYVTLTEFSRRKFIEGGLPAEKIVVKPNFIHQDPGVGEHRGGYALFVGRLSAEKGMQTLLNVWEALDGRRRLRIVGDGPMQEHVQQAARRIPGLEYLGHRPVKEVYALMAEAEVLIFPSEWYETFGRVAVEAFATGTPVIAANIGAIAEVVDHERTGLLFDPGDASDLTTKLEWLWTHPRELAQMRGEARREYETKYTAASNYRMLMDIYEQASARARGSR